MSILSDAYQFCKTVWDSPSRDEVRELIHSLNTVSRGDDGEEIDRGHFGYIARQQHAQVLGYLMVDQKRTEIEKGPYPWPVAPLRDQEKQILASVHGQIVRLNEQCVAPLKAALPKCAKAVDPYSRFQYVAPDDIPEGSILTSENVQAMASSFHQHPAFATALKGTGSTVDDTTESQYVQAVLRLTDDLLKAGVFRAPRNFDEITRTHGQDSPMRTVARFMAALICIRASLETLDQLVYQAILSKRLAILNEKNIITVGSRVKHLSGSGLYIMYQPIEEELLEPFDLILVKCSSMELPIDALYRVEGITVQHSGDFGETIQVELREIDENLNPFGPLFDYL